MGVAAVPVVCLATQAAAGFSVTGPYAQRDLTAASDGHRFKGNVVLPDGELVVSEDGPPYGDGRLHLVRHAGQPTDAANAVGDELLIQALVLAGGRLYGLSTAAGTDGSCPLYELDARTFAATVVRTWRDCDSELAVDPLTGDLLLQDGATATGQPGPLVELDPASGEVASTFLADPPSATVEGMVFDPSGAVLYIGNSAQGTSVDGVYAYGRDGSSVFTLPTRGSPDGLMYGDAGTCFGGDLVFTSDPLDPVTHQATSGDVYLLEDPGGSAVQQPHMIATAPDPDSSLLWLSPSPAGAAVISHNGQVTELACPQPPAQAPAPPPQAQPPAQPQSSVTQPQARTTIVQNASRGGGIALPSGPPPAPAAATQVAAQSAGQTAGQAAPVAGLADAPEEEHSLSLSASSLLPRLGAGGAVVLLLAVTAWWFVRDVPGVTPARSGSR